MALEIITSAKVTDKEVSFVTASKCEELDGYVDLKQDCDLIRININDIDNITKLLRVAAGLEDAR